MYFDINTDHELMSNLFNPEDWQRIKEWSDQHKKRQKTETKESQPKEGPTSLHEMKGGIV